MPKKCGNIHTILFRLHNSRITLPVYFHLEPPFKVALRGLTSLSANMTETPATFGITVGRWR